MKNHKVNKAIRSQQMSKPKPKATGIIGRIKVAAEKVLKDKRT